MIYQGKISSKIAKMVLREMFERGGDPSQIIEDKGWQLVSDAGEIEKAVQETIDENEKATADYKKGKESALQFLVGQVMAKTRGKAKPEAVKEILEKKLNV
jgi:aspartyl-tRNA(Asn)/glutamyl-tRNA(Gln) amidotransferase subunit B